MLLRAWPAVGREALRFVAGGRGRNAHNAHSHPACDAHCRAPGEPSITVNTDSSSDAANLLIEAGSVLASSLDLATTMRQVARLTVPSLADLCVIDLVADDGSITDVAVAGSQPSTVSGLEQLRRRYPVDPAGEHPVARVIRSGEPMLLPDLSDRLLSEIAQGSEHARFMIDNHYRSAVVVPLRARRRTLGTISVLRLGDNPPLDEQDLELALELARRAALAIDNARLYGHLQALERRQEAILTNLAEAITVEDEHGRTVFANAAAAELLDLEGPEQLTSARPGEIAKRFLLRDEHGTELPLARLPGRRLFRGEPPEPLLVRSITRATGDERWLLVRSSAIADPATGKVEFAANVFEDLTEVKRAQLGDRFMARAGRVFASSTDHHRSLREIARMAVPQLADWCAIDLLDERGEIELVAVHHRDADQRELWRRLRERHPPRIDERSGVGEVIRTGEARLYTDISEDSLAAYARDAEHLELLHAIGARAVAIVPLVSAVRTIGAITLISAESLRRLSQRDLDLLERLGRRAGTAVENARLNGERARIAHVLQAALLPESLPRIADAEVHARYSAAGELNEVGGDFYDVFARGPDRWVLVLGDVVGKGARAAGVTALARHTLRAAAMSGQPPEGMLAMLHQALRTQPPGADVCTVCLVTMTRAPAEDTAELSVALAGHPPPLLVDPAGEARQIGRSGTLLGVFDPVEINESTTVLSPGQTLLMYTDGVLDAGRASEPLGERGLLSLCRGLAAEPLEAVLAEIEREALARAAGALRDDIALLGLRLTSRA